MLCTKFELVSCFFFNMAQDPFEYDYMLSDEDLEEEPSGFLSQAASHSATTVSPSRSPSSDRDSPEESDHNSPNHIPSWCYDQGICKRPLAKPRRSKAKRRCQPQLNSDRNASGSEEEETNKTSDLLEVKTLLSKLFKKVEDNEKRLKDLLNLTRFA